MSDGSTVKIALRRCSEETLKEALRWDRKSRFYFKQHWVTLMYAFWGYGTVRQYLRLVGSEFMAEIIANKIITNKIIAIEIIAIEVLC